MSLDDRNDNQPQAPFDPTWIDELTRFGEASPQLFDDALPSDDRRSPFAGYKKSLTPEGGIHIIYYDQAVGLQYTVLRVFTWVMATGVGFSLIACIPNLNEFVGAGSLLSLGLINWLIVRRKLKVCHTVEIRPDCMILDDKQVFWASDIGDFWPELRAEDEKKPDIMSISGICGTRWIQYMTVNRIDDADRTPERLQAELKEAMEQMWGRREVDFAPTL